jgi:hypothetical protein
MKTGFFMAAFGLILISTALIFSTGFDSKMGIIENLEKEGQMYVILKEGEHLRNEPVKIYKGAEFAPSYADDSLWAKDEKGYYEIKRYTGWKGRITIPTKYPYWAGLVIMIIGFIKIPIGIITKYSD